MSGERRICSRESSNSEVISWLKENNLHEIVSEFEASEIDGEDLFGLEFAEICQLIPRFKIRKKFLSALSKLTNEVFDANGLRSPLLEAPSSSNLKSVKQVARRESSSICESPMLPIVVSPEKENVSDNIICSPVAKKSLEVEIMSSCSNNNEASPKEPVGSRSLHSNSISSTEGKKADPGRDLNWLPKFCIPTRWEPDIERALNKGQLNPQEKSALIRQLCTSIMTYTSYPTIDERTHIALLLIQKYPFLKGTFGAGHQMWVKKIQERFANVKKRLAKQETKRLLDEGVEVPKGKPGRKKKKGSTPIVPTIPDGENESTLEHQRKRLLEMYRKGSKDYSLVKRLMDNTYPKRRQDIILHNTRVWKILLDYPFLKDDKGVQIKAELERIEEKREIGKEIRELWEEKKPKILSALKKIQSRDVKNILEKLDECNSSDERDLEDRCIFGSLPYALGEKRTSKLTPGEFFLDFLSDDDDDAQAKIRQSTTPKLLASGSLEEIHSLALIAEGMVVVKFKSTKILNAVICLLASYYIFNAEYPKGPTGHSNKLYMFLDFILLGKKITLFLSQSRICFR